MVILDDYGQAKGESPEGYVSVPTAGPCQLDTTCDDGDDRR